MNQEQRIETHGWIAYDYDQGDGIIHGWGDTENAALARAKELLEHPDRANFTTLPATKVLIQLLEKGERKGWGVYEGVAMTFDEERHYEMLRYKDHPKHPRHPRHIIYANLENPGHLFFDCELPLQLMNKSLTWHDIEPIALIKSPGGTGLEKGQFIIAGHGYTPIDLLEGKAAHWEVEVIKFLP